MFVMFLFNVVNFSFDFEIMKKSNKYVMLQDRKKY